MSVENQGVHGRGTAPTEIPALEEIEALFPSQWAGFSNVIVRHPTRAHDEREIDLVLGTDDRVVMADLSATDHRLWPEARRPL